MLGKSIWWLANPLGYDTYSNIVSRNFDSSKLAQTIINRAPFGVVTEEKAPVPTIAEQIKVVGVYAAGPNNSIAFITVSGKNSIATIGDTVLDAKVKAITPDGVIFLSGNQDVTINLSSSNATPNTSNTSSNNHQNSGSAGYIPNAAPSNSNNNQDTQNHGNTNQPANNNENNATQGNDNDSIADKRRKMIEAFQKQNAGGNNNDNSNNGQQ